MIRMLNSNEGWLHNQLGNIPLDEFINLRGCDNAYCNDVESLSSQMDRGKYDCLCLHKCGVLELYLSSPWSGVGENSLWSAAVSLERKLCAMCGDDMSVCVFSPWYGVREISLWSTAMPLEQKLCAMCGDDVFVCVFFFQTFLWVLLLWERT